MFILAWGFPVGASGLSIPPAGEEFQVSTSDRGITDPSLDKSPKVSSAADGSFVVVWAAEDIPAVGVAAHNILGRRFNPMGQPLGTEFLVNTYTTQDQRGPHLVVDAAGNFVVVWASYQFGSFDIFGQRFNNTGDKVGVEEFPVNTLTAGNQSTNSISMDANGQFVVVWLQTSGVILAQRFNNTGATVGTEFPVNTNTSGSHFLSSQAISTDGSGNFVVVWENGPIGNTNIFGQRLDNTGATVGTEFPVNTISLGGEQTASVCTHSSGDFVVVWESKRNDGVHRDIFARRFDSAATALGDAFQVNVARTDKQSGNATVACDVDGGFVAAWQVGELGGNFGGEIDGRRFNGAGGKLGDEFIITKAASAVAPSVAVPVDSSGTDSKGDRFVVAWDSKRNSPPPPGVSVVAWARRYTNRCAELKSPCALTVSEAKLQYSEKKAGKEKMKLQWRNISGATTQAGFGNPVDRDTSVTLCIYADNDTLVQEFIVDRAGQLCVGKPCWKARGSKGYGYKDKGSSTDGILKIGYVSGDPGKGKADATGKNNAAKGQTALPSGVVSQLTGNVAPTIQLLTGDGLCVEATMNQVKKDKGMLYKAQLK